MSCYTNIKSRKEDSQIKQIQEMLVDPQKSVQHTEEGPLPVPFHSYDRKGTAYMMF